LERSPAIAPPLVRTDLPQSYYVHAEGATEVRVWFGAGTEPLSATALGSGLFRVDYDPRRDGMPEVGDGELAADIEVDGGSHARTLTLVRPRAHPRWIRVSTDGVLAALVSEETDELAVVDRDGLVSRVEVGDGPSDVAFFDETHAIVAHRFEPVLHVVDARRGEIDRSLALPSPAGRLAVSPESALLAVALTEPESGSASILFLALPSLELESRVRLPHAPDWIAFGPSAAELVVSTVAPAALLRVRRARSAWRVDPEPLLLGRPAVTLARAPDGRTVDVATTDYRRDGAPHLANHFVQDQILTIDVERFRVREQLLTARRSARQGSPGNVDRGVSPMGIAFEPAGSRLVAFAGTDEVARFTSARPEPAVVPLDEVPLSAPHGVAALADGSVVVSSPVDGAIGILSRALELRTLVRLAPDDETLLRESPDALARRMGEHVFYESTRAGIACQSCHMHTDTDLVLRNIGERRFGVTLSVRGLAGTAPYLRDASYPRIRDLDDLAHTLFRGFLRRAPGRAPTLEAFVESLPRRLPNRGERDVARERRGVAAFVRAGCVTCHAFPAFTNLGQHPIGAIFPDRSAHEPADAALDTPSLLSVSVHPPYLHDGRAATLSAIFREHNDGNRHGDTRALDDAALTDLVYFLEGL
jgi:DNA-binding beta-propeller fold protein YncE